MFGLREEEPRAPGWVILEMSCQQEWFTAKRTWLQEAFGHDDGLMTLLRTQSKLKFLSFTCCTDYRFGVSSGSVDKVLYFSFHCTGAVSGNVLLLFPNLPCGSERLFYGVSRYFKCDTFLLNGLSCLWTFWQKFKVIFIYLLCHSALSFKICLVFWSEAAIYRVVNLNCSKIRKVCKSWDLFLKCIDILNLHIYETVGLVCLWACLHRYTG